MNFFNKILRSKQDGLRLLFVQKHRRYSLAQKIKKEKVPQVIGQPSPLSHPHLLKPNELVPGFTLEDFKKRRECLMESLVKLKPNETTHIVLIPSAETQYMSDKIPFVFRQNTDFRYLTGCLEPDSALLMVVTPGGKFKSTLFVREKNAHTELWEGPRTGVDAAPLSFGVDEAKSILTLGHVLKDSADDNCTFWYDLRSPPHSGIHKTVVSCLSNFRTKDLESPIKSIQELRLIKSKSEQSLMLKAGQIASNAIKTTIENTEIGCTEHQLFAIVDYQCRMNGAEHLAYPPVVATGNNANIIHYINNNQEIIDGELILMDAGCELHGYSSDITRTWPANGVFSTAQHVLYDIVLDVQKYLISLCSEETSLDELFKLMCTKLGKNLKEAHVLSKSGESLKLEEMAFKFCPHHVGHYLGMDVHDTGMITRQINLREGMVITIEPGVYIDLKNDLAKKEFRGIGIRIEDDVLISEGKANILSPCPKSVESIMKLCRK